MLFFRKLFIKLFKKQINLSQLHKSRESANPIRLVIGSGYTQYKNWIITDIDTLDITKENDWKKYFKKTSISSILAEHVFEHLSEEDRNNSIQNIYAYLTPGGNFRIGVPDGYHPDSKYIDSVKPGGTGMGAKSHKFLYTYQTLSGILKDFGFSVHPLEYFDENRKFYLNEWNPEKGMIQRSALNDKRNKNGTLNYSSLIIDAIK